MRVSPRVIGGLALITVLGAVVGGSSLSPQATSPVLPTTTAVTTTLPAGSCSSITQYTVTFTFNKAVPCGQFVTGDYWVTPATGDTTVTITAMSPAYTGTRNGWEVNPATTATEVNQGFDSRVTTGGCCVDPTLVPALPYAAAADSSIIKAVSNPNTCVTGNVPCLTDVSILTVLGSVPANNGANTFRPGWAGVTKRLFTTAGLRSDLLPSLAPVAGTPTLAAEEARMLRPQFDPFVNFLGRFLHPTNAFYDPANPAVDDAYGAEASKDWNDAILRLMLNDSAAQKQTLLYEVVQAGIDQYVFKAAHNGWPADGGHFVGRRILVAFAGLMLGDASMQTHAGDTLWDENVHISFSSAAGVAGRQYFSDNVAPGMMLWGKSCAGSTYAQNLANINVGAKDCRDNLGTGGTALIDGGNPPNGQYAWCCTIANYQAESLIARKISGLDTIWNYPRFHNYVDRMENFGAWTLPDGVTRTCASGPCNFGPLHGTRGSITNGASVFGLNMWAAYKPTSTFCGTVGC